MHRISGDEKDAVCVADDPFDARGGVAPAQHAKKHLPPVDPPTEAGKMVWDPSRKKSRVRVAGFVGTLVVVALGGAGFLAWYEATLEPPMHAIAVVESAGLKCSKLVSNGTTAICEIPLAMYKAGPPEVLKAQGELTRNALLRSGVTTLYVRTAENQKLVLVMKARDIPPPPR